MQTDSTFLDALTQRGVLVSVSVRYWRAQRKLNPEDLGLTRDRVNDRLISLGHKRLVPKESLKRLAVLESRAHSLVEESTFPFLGGIAHYLPNEKLEEVTQRLHRLQAEFETETRDFLSGYARLREAALVEWRDAAVQLGADPRKLVAAVEQAFPSSERMPRSFGFEVRLFSIAVPDMPQAQLIDLGTRQELMQVRRDAAEQARREIEESCERFVGECVSEMRRQTAQLCSEMLATIDGTGSVHQKTLNRLQRFIERYKALNFAQDGQMERELEKARAELLSRSAEEYRGNGTAEVTLVQGLERLRTKARELAAQDTSDLAASFGRMGQRRFALAS
jgi:hypothetical protein